MSSDYKRERQLDLVPKQYIMNPQWGPGGETFALYKLTVGDRIASFMLSGLLVGKVSTVFI
jgi:hypothetical protein